MKRCTQLAEAIVSGEPLSDDDRAHLTTCADCTRLAAMPRLVAATATAPEPGPGFSSRIVVGARERVAGRRRQRVIGLALATAMAAGAAVMIVRHDDGGGRARGVATSERLAGGDPTAVIFFCVLVLPTATLFFLTEAFLDLAFIVIFLAVAPFLFTGFFLSIRSPFKDIF